MTAPDRWARIESVYHAALALPPEARAEFVARECGEDAVLLAEVESLLAQGTGEPADKIRHDLEAWRDSIVTTLLVGGDAAMIRQAAELVLG